MLRARTSLSRAALVLAAGVLWASLATAANPTIGGACTTGDSAAATTGDGNNVVCIGSVWQYPAYQFGASSASCNATNAGIVKWTGSALQACDGSTWQTVSTSGNGAMILISTQTASNSATLQWTGLGSTYNIYKLYCNGIKAVNNANQFAMRYGEGGTPTWETANYTSQINTVDWGGAMATSTGDSTIIQLSGTNISNGATGDYLHLDLTLYNVPSSTLDKIVIFRSEYRPDPGGGVVTASGDAYYYGQK